MGLATPGFHTAPAASVVLLDGRGRLLCEGGALMAEVSRRSVVTAGVWAVPVVAVAVAASAAAASGAVALEVSLEVRPLTDIRVVIVPVTVTNPSAAPATVTLVPAMSGDSLR